MSYRTVFYDNDAVFGNVDPGAYQLFTISVNNLSKLLEMKKTDKYEDFYRDFYQ